MYSRKCPVGVFRFVADLFYFRICVNNANNSRTYRRRHPRHHRLSAVGVKCVFSQRADDFNVICFSVSLPSGLGALFAANSKFWLVGCVCVFFLFTSNTTTEDEHVSYFNI